MSYIAQHQSPSQNQHGQCVSGNIRVRSNKLHRQHIQREFLAGMRFCWGKFHFMWSAPAQQLACNSQGLASHSTSLRVDSTHKWANGNQESTIQECPHNPHKGHYRSTQLRWSRKLHHWIPQTTSWRLRVIENLRVKWNWDKQLINQIHSSNEWLQVHQHVKGHRNHKEDWSEMKNTLKEVTQYVR